MRRGGWQTPDSSFCFLSGQRSRSLPFAWDGPRKRRSVLPVPRECTPGTRWAATTKALTTPCSSQSRNARPRKTSTGSPRSWRADEAAHREVAGRDAIQGALELMWRLQEALIEVSGLHACSLQPAAGSQGELTGLMLMRAYFADRGESDQRDTIITADTAHGTNPASVTMAGYKLAK